MRITTLKRLSLLFLFGLASWSISSYASSTIIITDEMISSSQSCALNRSHQGSVELHCSTYHQTTNYTCGPAAVMTLMRYYGKISPQEMNQATELRIAREMGAVPGKGGGTTLSEMADWLSGHGFSVDSGRRIDTDTIISNINKRIPTIIAYNGHWILAKGYNKGDAHTYKNQDEIIFSDSCCGTQIIPRELIDSMWQEAHTYPKSCGANLGEYIVATPG